MSNDQRDHPRIPLDVHVRVQGLGDQDVALLSHDWSTDSVFLRTRTPFPVGTEVRLSVVVRAGPNGPQVIELSGVVLRVQSRETATASLPPGMGIVLRETPSELRELLEAAVDARSRGSRPASGAPT